jgi:hypothetical protein
MEAHGNGSSSNINGHEYTSISQQEGDKNDDEIRNNIKSNDIVTAAETTDVPTLTPPAAPTKPQLRRRLFEKLRTKRRQMITQHHHQYDTTNATLEEENDGNLTSSGNAKAVMKKQSLVTHYYRVDTVPRKTLQLPRKKYNKNNATTTSTAFVVENEPPIHDTNATSNTTGTTTTSALRHSPQSIMNNKKRRNHPPHHEKVVNVILPGVPSYEEDWARDTHDYFNLIILVPVTVLNIMNWNWDILLSLGNNNNSNNHHHHHHRNNHNSDNIGYLEYFEQMVDTLQSAWTGDWFDIFFYFTAAYFIIDLLWIIILPICVKSPSTIIQHHIAVLLYIMIPYMHPHVRFCMGACMSVEINTWFLIARRVFNKQGFPPWTLIELNSWLSIRVKVISIFFYLTWISIRCILYPGLLIPFYKFSRDHTKQTGTVFHLISAACVLHAAFCLLNLKWSYELLMSKIRYFRRQYVQRKQQLRYDRNHPQNHNSSGDKLSSSSHRYQQDPSISEGL